MDSLTEIEVQNLRHIIDGHATIATKLDHYASMATDLELQNLLKQHANSARTSRQKLFTFLC